MIPKGLFLFSLILGGALLSVAIGWGQTALLGQANIEKILADTGSRSIIMERAKVLESEEAKQQIFPIGVVLTIAQELDQFKELQIKGWFEENMDIELSQTDLNWIKVVTGWFKTGYEVKYNSIKQALENLASAPEVEAPATDTEKILSLLQDFRTRISDLEGRVSNLDQLVQGVQTGSFSKGELTQMNEEIRMIKESLLGQEAMIAASLSGIDELEQRVAKLDRALGGQRAWTYLLLVLVILMIVWLVLNRIREISRTAR